ncbi:MAG: hypothetical protein M1531_11700 [Chloroflexi bacterium]|nr:hypothetical protein [Chloroflexota bacterium]
MEGPFLPPGWYRWVAAVLLLAGTWHWAETGPPRTALRAAVLMLDLFPGSPWRPLTAFRPAPTVAEVSYPAGGRTIRADLYLPPAGERRHPAIIAVHGVGVPQGMRDPRLVRLAESLARSGIVVLMPQLEAMVQMRMVREDVDALVGGVSYLAGHPQVDPHRIVLGGFCVSAAFSLLAAEDPRINEGVALVISFGSYYSLTNMLRALTTETYFCQGEARPWAPEAHVELVMVRKVIEMQRNASDATLLQQIFTDDKLVGAGEPSLVEQLSPSGRATYELLTNRDPYRVDELVEQLPDYAKEELAALSPETGLARLQAPLLILHGIADPTTPYCESQALAEAIRPRGKAQLILFWLFHHVNPVFPPLTASNLLSLYVPDLAKLYGILYQIMALV